MFRNLLIHLRFSLVSFSLIFILAQCASEKKNTLEIADDVQSKAKYYFYIYESNFPITCMDESINEPLSMKVDFWKTRISSNGRLIYLFNFFKDSSINYCNDTKYDIAGVELVYDSLWRPTMRHATLIENDKGITNRDTLKKYMVDSERAFLQKVKSDTIKLDDWLKGYLIMKGRLPSN